MPTERILLDQNSARLLLMILNLSLSLATSPSSSSCLNSKAVWASAGPLDLPKNRTSEASISKDFSLFVRATCCMSSSSAMGSSEKLPGSMRGEVKADREGLGRVDMACSVLPLEPEAPAAGLSLASPSACVSSSSMSAFGIN